MEDQNHSSSSVSLEQLTSSCKNEVFVSDLILSSQIETNRFSIVESVEKAHITRSHSKENDTPFVLITRSNYDLIPLATYLSDDIPKHAFVVLLLTCTLHTLKSITLLEQVHLVHGNLTLDAIGVTMRTKLPIIGDFSYAISTNRLPPYIDSHLCIDSREKQYHWAPERHLLYIISQRQGNEVEENDISKATDSFMDSTSILLLFSEEFKTHYRHSTEVFFSSLLGKEIDTLREELARTIHTWDVFSVSVSMLSLVGYGFTQSQYCNRHMIRYAECLVSCVHPDPKRRPVPREAADNINAILTGV